MGLIIINSTKYYKDDLESARHEWENERGRRGDMWRVEQEHENKIKQLKRDKEEIVESLANLDGFRGIKSLVNNMTKAELEAAQEGLDE